MAALHSKLANRKREGRDRILDASTKKEYEAGSRYKTSSSDVPKTTKKISDVLHGDRKTQEWEISKAFDKTSLKELALDIGIPSSRLSGMNTQELRGMLLAILKKGK